MLYYSFIECNYSLDYTIVLEMFPNVCYICMVGFYFNFEIKGEQDANISIV